MDVPEQAKKELEFIFVSQMDEVLKAALETAPFKDAPVPVTEPAAPELRA